MLEGIVHEESILSGQGRRKKWDRIWYDTDEREMAEKKRQTEDGGGREEERFSIHDRTVILTVGHTLILDLQVLVGPWAGVREDI